MKLTDAQASEETEEADTSDLIEELTRLQKQNQELRRRLHEPQRRPSLAISYYLIFIGGSALTLSIYVNNLALSIVGLGVLFSGVIPLAIGRTKHTTTGLVDATAISSMKALDRLLLALDYRGKPVYLPPSTSQSQAEAKVFIPAASGNQLPPETEMAGGNLVTRNPEGLVLTPPGQALADLFEEKLGVLLSIVDLDYLGSHLADLLVKDLGLVEGFMLTQLGNTVHVKMEGSAHASLCERIEEETGVCETLGCPLTSAIAIMLAKTTHEPITIDTVETSDDHKTIEAWYGILKT